MAIRKMCRKCPHPKRDGWNCADETCPLYLFRLSPKELQLVEEQKKLTLDAGGRIRERIAQIREEKEEFLNQYDERAEDRLLQ